MTLAVLMFGWEFPPHSSGGLGTACEGIVKALCRKGVRVTLVLPKNPGCDIQNCTVISPQAGPLEKKYVRTLLRAYQTPLDYEELYREAQSGERDLYGVTLLAEVERYADLAEGIARSAEFDVIHCHDWMTYPAGMRAKQASGKPLIVHVHATEFDRCGGSEGISQAVYAIEREGMHASDRVVAVSRFTRDCIVEHYGVPPEKVSIIHNAVEFRQEDLQQAPASRKKGPLVLFLGRITLQKGPDYFLAAARKVLQVRKDVTFVFAGAGDMQKQMVQDVAASGLGDRILFTGWLRGHDVDRMYQLADLYIMPSVSEPFGITPLEAMRNDVPVIISKQSGVSEVIHHCLKVDFWDIDELASKILAVLEHRELRSELVRQGRSEVMGLNWDAPAQKCIALYREALHSPG